MTAKSTISEYKWRRICKHTGLSKGKLFYTLGRCSDGKSLSATLDTLFQ